jgi:hypothetical protein
MTRLFGGTLSVEPSFARHRLDPVVFLPRQHFRFEVNVRRAFDCYLAPTLERRFARSTYTLITSTHSGKTSGSQERRPLLRSSQSAST